MQDDQQWRKHHPRQLTSWLSSFDSETRALHHIKNICERVSPSVGGVIPKVETVTADGKAERLDRGPFQIQSATRANLSAQLAHDAKPIFEVLNSV
jgi:hypothetical protein